MPLETFRGPAAHLVLADARRSLGDDAVVVSSRTVEWGGHRSVEMVVAPSGLLDHLRSTLLVGADAPRRRPEGGRPKIIALIGPTGAGKTTSAVKLAVHPEAFGRVSTAMVTLDTFRVAAVEQLATYAEAAGLPLEVVYHRDEVADAFWRLGSPDVVIVDTPGRALRSEQENRDWVEILERMEPDEVHLVLPAHLRPDAAERFSAAYRAFGATHLLITKLDEVPDTEAAVELALGADLPCHWVCDGQGVPMHLHRSPGRLLAGLGMGDWPTASMERVA